jgi:MFS transporter, SP family, sugar:H+ symporter
MQMESFLQAFLPNILKKMNSMLIGGMFFLVGAILNTFAVHINMLIIGRILLGFAVGFTVGFANLCLLQNQSFQGQHAE